MHIKQRMFFSSLSGNFVDCPETFQTVFGNFSDCPQTDDELIGKVAKKSLTKPGGGGGVSEGTSKTKPQV